MSSKESVALYTRVSTVEQNPLMQIDELRREAERRGWSPVEYADVITGGSTKRPALDALLAAVASGKVKHVLVWKLDRLGRSTEHLLSTIRQITERGATFTSHRDPGIDTSSATGWLILGVLASVAEFEKALIRERVQTAMDLAKVRGSKSGKAIGRPVVDVDLRAPAAMLAQGSSLKEAADACGVNRATLRRRLISAGLWPVSTTPLATEGERGLSTTPCSAPVHNVEVVDGPPGNIRTPSACPSALLAERLTERGREGSGPTSPTPHPRGP